MGWDGRVWEKPESLKAEGLGPVPSSKAPRLTPLKPGSSTPAGRPICVPGLRLPQPEAFGQQHRAGACAAAGPALVDLARGLGKPGCAMRNASSCAKWPSSGGDGWSTSLTAAMKALSGKARSLPLPCVWCCAGVTIPGWGTRRRQTRLAWKMVQGKRAWDKGRPWWDAKRRTQVQACVLACPVSHPDFPQGRLWLVVGRREGGTPWYRLTNEPRETEEQAWVVVLAYARRWQIE